MIFVFVVGGVRVYRESLARALEGHPELRVIGTASAHHAVRAVGELRPDVVLLDTSTADGIAAARSLAAAAPAARLVALAASDSDVTVIACAEAGVAAFVASEGTLDDVAAAAAAAVRGESACPPRIAAALLRRVAVVGASERLAGAGEFSVLTPREHQVLVLIDEGLSNKEIAARLCIELSTVKNHVHNLLDKLGARGRAEAAARMRAVAG
jgi:two-component system nitrate/nitrite response regulator NarL